jgi:hypothetical protein
MYLFSFVFFLRIISDLSKNNSFIPFIPKKKRKFLQEDENNNIPWAIINVWGFKDSPISWNKHEHGYFMNGENNYSFIVYNDGTYILYQALGTYDTYS